VADILPRKRFAEGMGYFALMSAVAVAIAPALSIGIVGSCGIVPMIVIAAGSMIIAFVLAIFQHSVKIEKAEKDGRIKMSDLFDRRAALPAGLMFLINCAFGSVVTFIALYGQAKGVQNIWLYFTVYAIATLISRPITGRIIDKKGFFVPGIVSTLGVVITLVLIALSSNIVMFSVAGVFAGVGLGTGMGTFQTMAVSSVPPARRGVATATFLFGLDAGIGVGAAAAGAIAGAIGYSNMYFVMAIFPAAAFFALIILGKTRIKSYSGQ
jgi:predicted MFS family arabinose efflux permease